MWCSRKGEIILKEILAVILMVLMLFRYFFSTAIGTLLLESESCFHGAGVLCFWKRHGVGGEKSPCSAKGSKCRDSLRCQDLYVSHTFIQFQEILGTVPQPM